MKSLKKLAAALFVCGIFQTAVFALDGGALLANDSTFKTNKDQKYYLNQKDVFTAWVKVPFADSTENYFISEALYKFEYNQNIRQMFNYVDLNLCKVNYVLHFDEDQLKLEGGRFYTSALSPIVYSQNADGIKASYKNKLLTASAFMGYTGLLNGNIVKMVNAFDYTLLDTKKVYSLQDKYFVTIDGVTFGNLFYNQSIGIQFTGAFRLNEVANTKMYATLLMKGPLTSNLIYNLDATAELSKYGNHEFNFSMLGRLVLGYYFNKGSVTANVIYASENFNAVTSHCALDCASEPEYNNLFKAGLSGTYKPLDNLMFSAGADIAMDVKKSYEMKGFQYNVAAKYQVLSDVELGLKWNQYFDFNKSEVNFNSISAVVKIAF